MSSSSTRPVTSKPRGICRYYNAPRGCFAGDKCKFLHGEPPLDLKPEDPPMLTPYDKGKRCRYYAQGFCKKGEACWFLHATQTDSSTPPPMDHDDDEPCSICFEKPSIYGLLSGCSHIFCTTCIKQWRDPLNKPGGVLDSGNTKKCPMCRAPSKFITPSSKFWREGTPEKTRTIQAYKESMARVPCRYFQKSLQKNKDRPICPYGKDCFYQHLKEDGTPFVFKSGVDICMRRYRISQRRGMPFDDHFMPFSLDLSSLDIVIPGPGLVMDPPRRVRMDFNRRDEATQNPGAVANAARRLRDVGRSLEMLNEAIGEGASLQSLDFAVEALRAGLGRLEGAASAESRTRRRARTEILWGEGAAATRDEEEVMERLEVLAEQMMASINAIRFNGDASSDSSGTGTPPPPLEPIELPEELLVPHITAHERRDSTGYGSDSSMPTLRSVSDSSDEGDMSDENEDEDEAEGEGEGGITRADSAAPTLAPEFVPQRVPLSDWGSRREEATRREAEQHHLNSEAETETEAGHVAEDPAFVTDGRGRVVWSSEENKTEATASRAEPEAEAEESESGTGTGSGSSEGTGRSFLDWLNTLF